MKPRVLIVEDKLDQLEGIEKDLILIGNDEKQHIGIEGFIIRKATNEEAAMVLLKKAVESSSPYDLVILDLSLPPSETNLKDSPEIGLRLLKSAYEQNAAKGVMVVSVYNMYDWVVKSFREGAVDFIAKPFNRATLQTHILKYFEKEGARIIEQRVADLVPYVQKALAYKLGVCFSRFVRDVVNETEGLESDFKERWGLDVKRDSQDSQVGHLISLEKAVKHSKGEWKEILSSLSLTSSDKPTKKCTVEELLDEIKNSLLPCLALKKVELTLPKDGKTAVSTFQDDTRKEQDVKAVLREIILGAISKLTNHDNSSTKTIEVSVKLDGNHHAEVHFTDNLAPIGNKIAEVINEGVNILTESRFERTWGLSIAQHIALRGGGRIKVQSAGAGHENNVIIYKIPLANHD